jgi:hypothetical protein
MRVLLVLGFVLPFVIGAFADPLTRLIRTSGAVPIVATGDAIDENATRDTLYLTAAGNDERAGLTFEFGESKIAFPLDYARSLLRAKVSHKPVLLYFTAQNDVQPRYFEHTKLRSAAVFALLKRFECAALFLDIVPHSDAVEAKRLYSHNAKLQDELLEEGYVPVPAFVVVRPDFDELGDPGQRLPLAKASTQDLMSNEATVIRFLDETLDKWTRTQTSGK